MTKTTKLFKGMAKGHRPLRPKGKRPARLASLDVTGVLVGSSAWKGQDGQPVSVYYDQALQNGGPEICNDVLSRIDTLMSWMDDAFAVDGDSGNIIVTDTGTDGGAYHAGCGFNVDMPGGSDWYEAVYQLLPPEGDAAGLTFGLAVAEICESYMGLQGKGWNCGGSGGEGLSRVLANMVCGGSSGGLVDAGFGSASSYDGTDWISKDQGSDTDYPSIGCSVLYIYWMLSQGFTIQQIIQAGEPDGSLASNWEALTTRSKDQAFGLFSKAVKSLGDPTAWTTDNPFGGAEPSFPPVTPTPSPVPTPTPDPTPTPTPTPPVGGNAVTLDGTLPAGTYPLGGGAIPPGAVLLSADQVAVMTHDLAAIQAMLSAVAKRK